MSHKDSPSLGQALATGNNTYTGNTTIAAGADLRTGGTGIGNSSAVSFTGAGTLRILANETIGSIASSGSDGTVVLTGTLTTGGNNASTSYGGTSSGAGGLTKVGSGTLETTNVNGFTGAFNVNEGRLIVSANDRGGDLNNASAVNFGGGILEIVVDSANTKTFTKNFNVATASTLAYKNTTATSRTLTLGTGVLNLGANLTIQNISTDTTLNNLINISRNITGSGNLIVEIFNNVASGAVAFSTGRVQLSGDHTAWTGNLVVAKGTAQFSGPNSVVPTAQSITLGITGDAFGAALGFNQGNTDSTVTNAITVTTGGVRLIRNNSGPDTTANITFSGPINLLGSLTLDHAGLGDGKSITVSGNATGAGGLNVSFVGPHAVANSSVRLTGTNDYTGATSVSSGKLVVTNTIGSSAVTVSGTGTIPSSPVTRTPSLSAR